MESIGVSLVRKRDGRTDWKPMLPDLLFQL